jgi:hypothetical protein
METSLLPVDGTLLESILPLYEWDQLFQRVRSFRPDVVILVARKMPRLMECLGLDFGPGCAFFSDLAIPFAHKWLRDARVAVIDDIVNVGTTLDVASSRVQACGAREIRRYALGAKRINQPGGKNLLEEKQLPVEYIWARPLSEREHLDLARRVPQALGFIAKPYDLEFPIIPCHFTLPFIENSQILEWLREEFGHKAVHAISRPTASEFGLSRFTVDVDNESQENLKLRLYLDERTRKCNLVPFALPNTLPKDETISSDTYIQQVFSGIAQGLRGMPAEAEIFPGESEYRLKIFLRSLTFGHAMLREIGDVLTIDDVPCSLADATLLFGPDASTIFLQNAPDILQESTSRHKDAPERVREPVTSPFFDKYIRTQEGQSFLASVRGRVGDLDDRYSLFRAFFEELALRAGTSNYNEYNLAWPFSQAEVRRTPYLRLRLGPTFGDLLAIMADLWRVPASEQSDLRHSVSALLDWAIDDGAVVPTVAQYEGSLFRVYRLGENRFHDIVTDRTAYALTTWAKPISLTRLSKVLAILSFSSEVEEIVSPSSLPRGTAAVFPTAAVDKEVGEVSHYMRAIGRLKRARGRVSQ